MTRYITRLASDYEYGSVTVPDTITVHVPDAAPKDTGLLDVHGAKIYRVEEREPMGFRVTA